MLGARTPDEAREPSGRTVRGVRADHLDRRPSGLAGIVAAAVALSIAELAGAASHRIPGPVVAVGDFVIRNAPGSSSRTAVETVGRADKPLLVAGIVVAWAVTGLVAGRAVSAAPRIARVIFVGPGALAAVAATREPGSSPIAVVVAAVLALGAGLAVLTILTRPIARGRVGSKSIDVRDRRRLLGLTGAAAAAAVAVGVLGRYVADRMSVAAARAAVLLPRPARMAAPIPAGSAFDVPGLSALVTPNDRFYRIDTALVAPNVDPSRWSLRVTGMVDSAYEISYEELLAMSLIEEHVTICCVSNEVGGDLIGNAKWLGVPLVDLLDRADVQAGATQVVGRSVDGFTVGFPTDVGLDGRVALVAVGMNDEPLPIRHGFPARLIVAGLYGYVSATKWLAEIELTTLDAFDAYWIPRGWDKEAPIKTQSRFDVIRRSTAVPGSVTLAGVAWAPTRGIAKVEVQVDDGGWNEAHLATAIGDDTWRQWRLEVPATQATHTFRVRATDGRGALQTDEVAPPPPNGATGYHTVTLDV